MSEKAIMLLSSSDDETVEAKQQQQKPVPVPGGKALLMQRLCSNAGDENDDNGNGNNNDNNSENNKGTSNNTNDGNAKARAKAKSIPPQRNNKDDNHNNNNNNNNNKAQPVELIELLDDTTDESDNDDDNDNDNDNDDDNDIGDDAGNASAAASNRANKAFLSGAEVAATAERSDGDSKEAEADTDDPRASRNRCHRALETVSVELEFLRNHCWGCHKWIHHPRFVPGRQTRTAGICKDYNQNDNDNQNDNQNDNDEETSNNSSDDEEEEEICYYALHLHPVLQVPVCIVCAENIEAVEQAHRYRQRNSMKQQKQQKQKQRHAKSRNRPLVSKASGSYEEEDVDVDVDVDETMDCNGDDDDDDDDDNDTDDDYAIAARACSACGKSKRGERDDDDDGNDDVHVQHKSSHRTSSLVCGVCSRTVCSDCFKQAHDGVDSFRNGHSKPRRARRQQKQQQKQKQKQTHRPWTCLCCPCIDDHSCRRNNRKEKKKDEENAPEHNKGMTTTTTKRTLPNLLQRLRSITLELFSEEHQSAKNLKARHKHQRQTLKDALDELECLETEKRSCERKLEDESHLCAWIRNEVVSAGGYFGHAEREQRVQEIHREWIDHQTRLLDRIAILQDRLKSEYGIEAHAAFLFLAERNGEDLGGQWGNPTKDKHKHKHKHKHKQRGGGAETETGSGSSEEEDDDVEPFWKQSADRAIAKRIKAERKALRKAEKQRLGATKNTKNTPRTLSYPDNDLAEDAEDLGSSSSSSSSDSNKGTDDDNDKDDDDDSIPDSYDLGWRNYPTRASRDDIDRAMHAEDLRRVEEGKTRLVLRQRRSDKEEIRRWETGLASSAAILGATALSTRNKNHPKRELPTRTRTISPAVTHGNNNNNNNNDNDNNNNNDFQADAKRGFGSTGGYKNRNRRKASGTDLLAQREDEVVVHTIVGRSKRGKTGFRPSSLVLSTDPLIVVDERLERHLKEHQREGIRFMFENAFADLGRSTDISDAGEDDSRDAKNANTKKTAEDDRDDGNATQRPIGGCILAHSMGLGKSLSCLTLLHTVMLQPSLRDASTGRGPIHKVILVVPVNTIANWANEFDRWTKGIQIQKLPLFNVSGADTRARRGVVEQWSEWGGVLLTSDALFRNLAKIKIIQRLLENADAIVLDESHTMLKNKDNLVFKACMSIKTQRRVCLTGTPFQNNLLEYYRMISYIRPKLFEESERKFQKKYSDPIQAGMATDAPEDAKQIADERMEAFFETVRPYVHRRDASLLLKDLPSLQQVCVHLRPTKLQRALYRAYRHHMEVSQDKNFLKQFVSLRSVHNHPGTLLLSGNANVATQKQSTAEVRTMAVPPTHENPNKEKPPLASRSGTAPPAQVSVGGNVKIETTAVATVTNDKSGRESPDSIIEILSSSDEQDDDEDSVEDENIETSTKKWWTKTANKFGTERMNNVESGNKCIVLLHILVQANILGEKTVVFSQSLKTLDFLSNMLASKNWQDLCPSLKESFQDQPIGGWVQGKDFLRIDGATSGFERGELLKDFGDHKCLKLFLISSKAGGIGINLVSANRVVLFDSHFNPTIDLQAIYRCYRYGQNRNVYAYRFLTQGSMEEKVYSRAVTKIGLGNRVIDGKELRRCFKNDEIDSLGREDDWIECVKCKQWRMFPPDHTADLASLPDDWVCEMMNEHDARMKLTCSFEEKDSVWYYHHFKKPNEMMSSSIDSAATDGDVPNKLSAIDTEKLVQKDVILQKILTISSRSKKSERIVSKHYFHEALVSDIDPSGPTKKTETTSKGTSKDSSGKENQKIYAHDPLKEKHSTPNGIADTTPVRKKGKHAAKSIETPATPKTNKTNSTERSLRMQKRAASPKSAERTKKRRSKALSENGEGSGEDTVPFDNHSPPFFDDDNVELSF